MEQQKTITIKDAVEAYCNIPHTGGAVPTNENGYWEVDVLFDNKGAADETEFDIPPHHFDTGRGKCEELEALWKDFCKENNLQQNTVISIRLKGGW